MKKIKSPRTKVITFQATVIGLLLTWVYVALISPANATQEIKDSQAGHMGNVSKHMSNPIPSLNAYGPHPSKPSPTKITDPNSLYGSPYGNTAVNNSYASQPAPIINRSK